MMQKSETFLTANEREFKPGSADLRIGFRFYDCAAIFGVRRTRAALKFRQPILIASNVR
jgi:hypothetical protein